MMLNSVCIVLASICLAMSIVYSLINRQSREDARERINQAAQVVAERFMAKSSELQKIAKGLSTADLITGQVNYIMDVKKTAKDLKRQTIPLCSVLYEQMFFFNLKQAAIYDLSGSMYCAVVMKDDSALLILPEIHGQEKLLVCHLRYGEPAPYGMADIGRFNPADRDLFSVSGVKPQMPEAPVLKYKLKSGQLWLEAAVPIVDKESNETTGNIIMSDTIDEGFVSSVSADTLTKVNLFIGDEMSVGNLKQYAKLDQEAMAFQKQSVGNSALDNKNSLFRATAIDDSSYFEGFFAFSPESTQTAAFSILYSQQKHLKQVREMLIWLMVIGGICLILVLPFGWRFANSISRPVLAVVAGLKDAAEGEGDLTKRINIKTNNEIGELAHWFNAFIEKLQITMGDVASNTRELNQSSTVLAGISQQMSSEAEQTSAKAQTVAGDSEKLSTSISSISSSMEQTAGNMNLITSSTEELAGTINEIAKNTERARNVTDDAVRQSKQASSEMAELENASHEIGKVLETITEISEQVNLLALNATIEAARAGESGRGFAVVANEIKELARQTSTATSEIRLKINGIQGSTAQTLQNIKSISLVVNDVNDIVASIAASIEEQSASTQEIGKNVAQANHGINLVNNDLSHISKVATDIAGAVSEVNLSAGDMSSSSGQVKFNSDDLFRCAHKLNETVERFKI